MTEAQHPVLDSSLMGYKRVRDYLHSALSSDKISHAYLFVGPSGSGKTDTALRFAAAILCEKGGCGTCDSCIRVLKRVHPDVHFIAPQGPNGYAVDQIRDLIHDTVLAPIRAKKKIYIIDRVDLLRLTAANAFLKTLEEPLDDTIFILLGRSKEALLPTILSRCQVVPFRTIPREEAVRILMQESGANAQQALIALTACGNSVTKARGFLLSPKRQTARKEIIAVLARIPHADDLDILNCAKTLLDASKVPLDDVYKEHSKQLEQGEDFLTKSLLKALEQRQNRALKGYEREALNELLDIIRTWLGDCLSIASGKTDTLINTDDYSQIARISAQYDASVFIKALEAINVAATRLAYTVTPQLVIESMLFDIRKVFPCPM